MFNQNKSVFNKMYWSYHTALHNIKMYFYSIKIDFYSIKYIFIISGSFAWIKKYFYLIKINLCSIRNVFIKYIYNLSTISFYYKNFFIQYFSGEHIFHLCYRKNVAFCMYIEQQHEAVKKVLRKILEYCVPKTK